jgi:hypothetical protein
MSEWKKYAKNTFIISTERLICVSFCLTRHYEKYYVVVKCKIITWWCKKSYFFLNYKHKLKFFFWCFGSKNSKLQYIIKRVFFLRFYFTSIIMRQNFLTNNKILVEFHFAMKGNFFCTKNKITLIGWFLNHFSGVFNKIWSVCSCDLLSLSFSVCACVNNWNWRLKSINCWKVV